MGTMLEKTQPLSPLPSVACVSFRWKPGKLQLTIRYAACRLPGNVDSESSFWDMLVEKRTGQTPKVPSSRFNIDAHLHENLERPGSFNVEGGYFLNGQPEDFDPGFFNMTPIEAQWLDPQQRRILEVSYEALVSAGLTLESVSGSNTAVFIGSFTADYRE
jgi:acyl transferase domain-containing protein